MSVSHKNKSDSKSSAEPNHTSFSIKHLSALIVNLSRRSKQLIVLAIDVFYIILTVWLSFSFRYDTFYFPHGGEWFAYLLALLVALPIFIRAGFYRAIFRYSGFNALSTVAMACLKYGLLYFVIIAVFSPSGIPRSIGIMQPLFLLLAVGSSRAMARFWFHPGSAPVSADCAQEMLLIYGAGSAGVQIASALQHNANYAVAGYVDDDPTLSGRSINGVMVYKPEAVASLVKSKSITSILIAMPSATRARRQEIFSSIDGLGVHVRTLPGIEAIADGKVSISDIREIDIEDLLGRDPVSPDAALFKRCIDSKCVLVTGAGGSIGSELCRQILAQNPDCLLLVEQSEYNLYALHKELEERMMAYGHVSKLVPLLGDVTDRRYMQEICHRYHPHTIYHAAAYKHVPMVEGNPYEGLRNNVFGTFAVAEAARQSGVKNMVLVSTDKAVRPTNIMGATKRISELILQAMAEDEKGAQETCFSMVRFGNVLGSSGSVVPLFRQQISNGGPVTVTHRDVTRYFMTIPEAAQLVIQAGAMATGGDVFLLDMGEPVKIIDLARRMIELSGLTHKDKENPDGDIEIVVTGLRPGEKLYEELLIADTPIPTGHPRIFKAHETLIPFMEMKAYLDQLEEMITAGEGNIAELKSLVKEIVKGYQAKDMCNVTSAVSVETEAVVL